MKPFTCDHCGQTVFFENSQCSHCGACLGFVPGWGRMAAFDVSANSPPLRACANRTAYEVCNWMVDEDDDHLYCRSCRLTSHIPDLSVPGNLQRWAHIEQAKRRLIYTLIQLGLAPQPKAHPDDPEGLSFQWLASTPDDGPVLTGHAHGCITLNIAEADDVHRESARVQFQEPVRTVLGHLRHEVSHYLQYRHVEPTPAIEPVRALFGDERTDYAQALSHYHAEGPPPDWESRYISAYASAHPWEDWAETCAHYLLMIDAVETAAAWGLRLSGPAEAKPDPHTLQRLPIAQLALEQWLPVAQFLNAMNRSLGIKDSYPFLVPNAVLDKLTAVEQALKPMVAKARPGALETVSASGT